MTTTSAHVAATADAVAAGAHVVLCGDLHDEVLLDGRVEVENIALARALVERAHIDAVLIADPTDGLRCFDPSKEAHLLEALHCAPVERDALGRELRPALRSRTAVDVARTVRALMRQVRLAVAVLLVDLDLMVDTASEQGRTALALLRRAVAEAKCRSDSGPVVPRNAMVVLSSPQGRVASDLAALPGVRTLEAARPSREVRRVVLRQLAAGFYDATVTTPALLRGLRTLADLTHDWPLRELEQLRRRSHAVRIGPERPQALLATMPGQAGANAIARVGVETIMKTLEDAVVGQPRAMAALRGLLEDAADSDGRLSPDAPLMTGLLFGPPGAGKTEVVRALARALHGSERAIVRIDCAELRGPHDLARLTGAPPGYVGHETGGSLTEPLRRSQDALVLLDEIEKADPGLGEMLLSMLEDGRLTDGRGETVHFGHTIVMLTTNLGGSELRDILDAGVPDTDELLEISTALVRDALSRPPTHGGFGRPELWSRLQGNLIGFDVLREHAVGDLVGRLCRKLETSLADRRDIALRIDDASFTDAFARQLGPAGCWDGRTVRLLASERITRPLRAQLRGCQAKGPMLAYSGPDVELLLSRDTRDETAAA